MSRDELIVAAMEIREECKSHPVSCAGCSWFNDIENGCAFSNCNTPEEWRFRIYITEEGEK